MDHEWQVSVEVTGAIDDTAKDWLISDLDAAVGESVDAGSWSATFTVPEFPVPAEILDVLAHVGIPSDRLTSFAATLVNPA